MARTDTCTLTTCEHSYQACKEQEAECWSQCSLMLDYAAECASACSSTSCSSCISEDDDTCALYSYQFEIKSEADPALLTACKAAVARDQVCGEAHLEADCDHFARLEDPQYAGVYSCVAATPCGDDVGACFDSIPPALTAKWFAEEFNSICANQYVMEPAQVAALAEDLSWMSVNVRAALSACTDTYYCENVIACEEAWFAVVFPQP